MGYYLPTWKASKINYIVDNHTMDLPPRMRIHNHISPNLECCECYISGSMPVDAASHESDLQTICWYLSSQLLEIEGVSNVELFFFGHPPKVLPAVQQALTSKQPEAEICDGHAYSEICMRVFQWNVWQTNTKQLHISMPYLGKCKEHCLLFELSWNGFSTCILVSSCIRGLWIGTKGWETTQLSPFNTGWCRWLFALCHYVFLVTSCN